MANYVLVYRAEKHSKYSARHIRHLVQTQQVDGYKEGGIIFVDLDDLKRYEEEMDELGSHKFDPTRSQEQEEGST